ncbi:MAG: NAD+ synthase [Candidatus Bathyarchaeia archaeon]
MKLTQQVLELDWEEVKNKLTRFIKDYVEKSKAKGIVLGLSGGVDSSTAASLSAMAIGGNKVFGLILPEKETYNPKDIEHAKLVAEKFGIKTETIDITPTLEALQKTIPAFDPEDRLCKGNLKARTRMLYLYYYANKFNLIVCGSSDKSETMIGYFTKWGDIAADIAPLMDLYKTQVRKLAKHISVPDDIVSKPPTPMLWPGQTAEEEIGMKYDTLDLILYGLEHFMKVEEIAEQLGLEISVVEKIEKRWKTMEHKRRMPLTTKIQYRTIGFDFRTPHAPSQSGEE